MKREQHRNNLPQSCYKKAVLYKNKRYIVSPADWTVIGVQWYKKTRVDK